MAIRVTENKNTEKLRRVMIVDDSRLMRKAVSKILGKLYDIVEGVDGKDAWKMLQEDETIEVICCDLSMPILDGFGFLKLVQASEDERIKKTPVIIVTGQEDTEENRDAIFRQGAVDFVSKPFDSIQLKARIKAHLRQIETVQKLESRAAIDPVTGLGTREFFAKAGQQQISFANRQNDNLIIVRLAVDNFQELFLQVGKVGSGAILRKVGEIISKYARTEDILSRVGLDGFAALLHTTDVEGAIGMSERIRDMVAAVKINYKGKSHNITISSGLCCVEVSDDTKIDDLLERSARQLAMAQKDGGNRIVLEKESVSGKFVAEKTGPLTVEEALELIRKGETETVAKQIDGVMKRILPLLVLYEKVEKHGLKEAIMALRASIR